MGKIAVAIKEVLVPVITVATATMVGILNFSVSKVETQLQQRDQEIRERDQERIERESLETFNFKIYDAVRESLEVSNPQQQEVAKALVTYMADEPLRTGLLNVLRDAGTEEVKREVAGLLEREQKFNKEEAEVEATPRSAEASFDWEDIDYDIFWCESSGPRAEEQATRIVEEMRRQGAKGRLRVRLLPDSINARPGYQHSGYVIRLNRGEEQQARRLKQLGNEVLAEFGADFEISLSRQSTRWYLSAFICP